MKAHEGPCDVLGAHYDDATGRMYRICSKEHQYIVLDGDELEQLVGMPPGFSSEAPSPSV